MEITVGTIVFSKAGRDKRKMLLAVRVEDNYVYVCDGLLRKVEKPKKKKLIHLQKTNYTADIDSDSLTNSQVRGILAEYKPV